MSKENISSLSNVLAEDISNADLLTLAREDVDNFRIPNVVGNDYIKNHSTDMFPIDVYPKDIKYNNIDGSVTLLKKLNKIESLTFDEYGMVSNIESKVIIPTQRQLDNFSGTLSTRMSNNATSIGYFDKYKNLKSAAASLYNSSNIHYTSTSISNIQYGNWAILFDKTFDFRKSIVTYQHARLDISGSLEDYSYYKVFIYWNGENNTKIESTGLIRNSPAESNTLPFYFHFHTVLDNIDVHPMVPSFGNQSFKSTFNKLTLNVDGTNKKINKLPLSPFVTTADRETHSISITIESFV